MKPVGNRVRKIPSKTVKEDGRRRVQQAWKDSEKSNKTVVEPISKST